MVDRVQPLGWSALAGLGVAGLLAALSLGTIAAVALRAESGGNVVLGPADWAALRFTVTQAALSATISCLLAIPLARALSRQDFPGRGLVITLIGAPFLLPVIVAILGLVMVFGRSGMVSSLLGWVGLPPVPIYGLGGVVLAHVFFNLPLATRFILHGWLALPAEHFRLAEQLGMGRQALFRHLEWPVLRAVLPGAFATVFLLCTASFAVVLALGGGPRATNVELAIYQAFRFDFDLGRAALLALVQTGLCAVAALGALVLGRGNPAAGGLDRGIARWDGIGRRWGDGLIILGAVSLLVPPLAAIALRGASALGALPPQVLPAALRSLAVALGAAGLCIALTLALAFGVLALERRHRWLARGCEGLAYLTIAASPMVVGTGLFILIFPVADPVALSLPITLAVNAAIAIPFALRVILPAAREAEARYGRLAEALGMRPATRLRLVLLPRMRRATGFAAGIAAALSMGDLGVIALFARPDHATLPLVLHSLMAGYRMEAAAATALVLTGLSLGLFWAFDRGGRAHAAA